MKRVRLIPICLIPIVALVVCDSSTRAQAERRVSLGPVTVSGPIPSAEAKRVLRAAMRSFQQCYEDRLRERSGLAGRTVTRIFVSSDGSPIVAQVDQSDLGDAGLERCIKSAALVLAFSEHATADSHVRFELRFGNSSRPSGEAHTVTAGPEDPRFRSNGETGEHPGAPPAALRATVYSDVVAVSGRPEAQVASALRRAMPRMRRCYEDSLTRDRSLEGELRVRFVVDPRGRTARLHVEEESLGDYGLVGCVGEVLTTTRFPSGARGDAEVVARIRLEPPRGLTNVPTPRSG